MLDDTEVAAPSATVGAEAPDLAPGAEIAGYVVDAKIGQGGMGKVYGAHHPRIGKRVAIKVLARSYCNDASAVARFEQEARLVNEIRHPNIVDVFQFGELPDKRSFFVMEWLDGETLSDRIDKAPLETDEAIEILDAICDALEAAHEHGVIHRDLKSDNVFLATSRNRRTVKLLDFGIAKLAGTTDLSTIGKTASGMIVGTPSYMSPEQARGHAVSPQTDVYQLGILTYKMLTGVLPFHAENPFDLIVEQIKTPAPSPKKLAPKTPDLLARLIVRMMAKESEARPSIAEVRAVIAELRDVPTKTRAPRATRFLLGLTLFLAGFVSLGVVFVVRERNKESETPAALESATGSNAADVAQPPALAEPASMPASAPAAAPVAAPTAASVAAPAAEPAAEPASESAAARMGDPGAPAGEPAAAPAPAEIEIEPSADPTPTKTRRAKRPPPKADDDVAAEPPPIAPNRPGAILFTLKVASTIEIDGVVVASSSRGGRFEVSPGVHEIRVKGVGRQPVTRSVEVPAGGVAVIGIEDDLTP